MYICKYTQIDISTRIFFFLIFFFLFLSLSSLFSPMTKDSTSLRTRKHFLHWNYIYIHSVGLCAISGAQFFKYYTSLDSDIEIINVDNLKGYHGKNMNDKNFFFFQIGLLRKIFCYSLKLMTCKKIF